ncbi:VCBS repeat-containing protein [Kineosporia sp. A_224]|uniref:FG-GAP repeat domain-containing protein n=1 Tax=Kineosporia sp. A_224 TaxID=1962180 RepID=UPI0013042103|nr:VCBS repeat-containing protein [Kineosporia sp. A_224]
MRGDGLHAAVRRTLATGWGGYDATTRVGDLDRDGYEDVVARSRTTGRLLLFRGTGTRLRAPVRIGGPRWAGMREITGVGDLDGDGYGDLVAVEKATGRLYLVPGRGTSLGARRLVGLAWASMGELAGVGDLDRDGHPDLVARKNATGELFLYRGKGSGTTAGFWPRVRIGASGWDAVRDLVGAGDVDRDGWNDLLAVDRATGRLLRYPGTGTGLRSRQVFGTGFTADLRPLA